MALQPPAAIARHYGSLRSSAFCLCRVSKAVCSCILMQNACIVLNDMLSFLQKGWNCSMHCKSFGLDALLDVPAGQAISEETSW